ncbi:sulfite exporter TauE/SafE family protein [Niabella beijingensis]|uniref:sulfite exporter TauE/SafE family protein n=1 Tax=Niabella beijingensis TaxID=2872700 RepID=UPI001CBE5EA8|nr:sulfite exporter TauE/SafE family protein [Niabella beijingensis]MBZ4191341.1 sulfite exporter TauE/SafE family protein [Niabella beijingensis]
MHTEYFYFLLFGIAFLYASVGHGGASGYLALMAISGAAPETMKPTALILNLFVSLTSFIQYYRGGHFRWKLFLPFILTSFPLAFLGGRITIDAGMYKRILGILLVVSVIRFLCFSNVQITAQKRASTPLALLIGAAIGFFSGLIGIGGGILLSPLLLLLRWADMKQAAAVSALFIFVNSVSGLAGQMTIGLPVTPALYGYIAAALAGGLCGAYFGALKFGQATLKYILSAALTVAALKLVFV